jgi:hypothetical protein
MLKDAVKPVSVDGCTPAQESEILERLKMAWVITETLLGIRIDLFEPGVLTMTPGITEARRQGSISVGGCLSVILAATTATLTMKIVT